MGKGQGAAATSGTRAAAVSRSGTARAVGWAARLGFGPVGARAFFLNNFAERKKRRKITKNPKMPKHIFTV